jgi:CBS domain-containing protein
MSGVPRRRTVADVMTARVHVAGPLTPFKLLVRLIQENRVSAIPIVDVNGFPLGIVSESDLLLKERRHELESEPDLLHIRRRHRERAKADALVASDLMTTPPITVSATTGLTLAARMMQVRNVRRLIVVDERGRIAGVVSRSDLLQVFLRTDEELRDEIVDRLIPALMLSADQQVGVEVRYNVVTLTGEVDRRSDAEILTRMTKGLDGVVAVESQLTYKWDDSKPVREFAQPARQSTESI